MGGYSLTGGDDNATTAQSVGVGVTAGGIFGSNFPHRSNGTQLWVVALVAAAAAGVLIVSLRR